MTRLLKRVGPLLAAAVLIPAGAFSAYLLNYQEQMIYHPRSYGASYAKNLGGETELRYVTSQGRQVSFYVPPRQGGPPRKLWVLFAGNASLALDWRDFLMRANDPVDGFLLVEYPGYGGCEGEPSPASILESSQAALVALKERLGVFPQELSVLGHSLGAAAALQFAAKHPVRQIVLAAPFTSLHDMARRVVGLPFAYLLKHDFDNRAQLEVIARQPLLPQVTIFHGLEDSLIPPSMGKELSDLHPAFVVFHPVPGGRHESILYDALEPIAQILRR